MDHRSIREALVDRSGGKLDESKAIQKEKDAFAAGKKGGGDVNATDFIRFGGGRGLPSYFESSPKALLVKEGLRFSERVYMRTRDAAILKKDFTFDVLLSPDWEGGSLNKTLYIGVGTGLGGGQRNPYNVPVDSAFISIQPPSVNEGEVVVANSPEFGKGDKIGHIREKGNHMVRVEKKGETVTFSICTNYDGKFNPDITHTVSNLRDYVPALTDKNTHIFLGGAGTYKQVRLVYGR